MISPLAYIHPEAKIGENVEIGPFVFIDKNVEIGDNNTIRENVTINRGTAAKGKTIVGNNNLLMEGVHVAHDTIVGSGCIIGNSTKMAGEVIIDDNAIVSANVLMHQFCRVGGYVMIQGGCRFSKDIPPYIVAAHEPIAFYSINTKVLELAGFSETLIKHIAQAYRILYKANTSQHDALLRIQEQVPNSPEIERIIEFVKTSKLGIIH